MALETDDGVLPRSIDELDEFGVREWRVYLSQSIRRWTRAETDEQRGGAFPPLSLEPPPPDTASEQVHNLLGNLSARSENCLQRAIGAEIAARGDEAPAEAAFLFHLAGWHKCDDFAQSILTFLARPFVVSPAERRTLSGAMTFAVTSRTSPAEAREIVTRMVRADLAATEDRLSLAAFLASADMESLEPDIAWLVPEVLRPGFCDEVLQFFVNELIERVKLDAFVAYAWGGKSLLAVRLKEASKWRLSESAGVHAGVVDRITKEVVRYSGVKPVPEGSNEIRLQLKRFTVPMDRRGGLKGPVVSRAPSRGRVVQSPVMVTGTSW
jgi:hypothetical protein